jgi:uncharacterized membrane protein
MTFCQQCGKQLDDADKFCPGCGRPQEASPRGNPANFWANVSDQNAALLCYIPWVGWIPAIAVLASTQFKGNRRIRFHAFQGLYLFVAYLLVDWFVAPIFRFGPGIPGQIIPRLLTLAIFAAWIVMLIKVHQNEDYRLPILGELADRSVSEQRG